MVAAKNSKLLLWLRILQERKNSGKMNHLITYITLKRRRLRNLQFLLLQNEASSQSYDRIRTNHKRSCRRYLRNSGWFSNVWENYCDKRFKTIFRVSKDTFTNVLGFIRDDLQREYLCTTPIWPEERLGICLYPLGCEDYYQTKSELTGRGIATVRNITQEVSNIILDKLWKKIVVFPKTKEEFFNSISAMETLWLFPTAFGGVDGCHIPLKCPHGVIEARKEYYNFKSFYSVVMMGIVGADYRF